MANTVYLLLGSNEGNRLEWFEKATLLLQDARCRIVSQSAIYETAAWGLEDQPDFLNMALCVETSLHPQGLLALTQNIEALLGRQRTIRWGQRTLEIDILLFNNDIIKDDNLQVPHPQLQNRRFALIPLYDIAASYIHPALHKTVATLLAECPDKLEVRNYKF